MSLTAAVADNLAGWCQQGKDLLADVADELGQWTAEGCPVTRADMDTLAHAGRVLLRLRDELRAAEARAIAAAMATSSAPDGVRE